MTRAQTTSTTQQNTGGAVVPFAAGKNKIINGDFTINQRAFSSATVGGTYGFDRWRYAATNGTVTYSAQTFTLGTAPVAGYESANFARLDSTGQSGTDSNSIFLQRVESVRTFANQTVTVSFWAKAGSGTPKVAVELSQNFGTGGSPSTQVNTYAGQITLSTSWTRYSVTVVVPSISGKTIGSDTNSSYLGLNLWTSAGSDFNARTGSLGIQTATIDFWGIQLESGSVATPFQTATGTLQGELAACQRYYFRNTGSVYSGHGVGSTYSTTQALVQCSLPVEMRVAVSSIEYSNIQCWGTSGGTQTVTTLTLNNADKNKPTLAVVSSGLTAYQPLLLFNNNSATAYVAFNAEL